MELFLTIFEYIMFSCLMVTFVIFEPFNVFRNYLEVRVDDNYIYFILYKLFTCAKCAGFWISLFYFQNLLVAAFISLLSELIYRKITTIKL